MSDCLIDRPNDAEGLRVWTRYETLLFWFAIAFVILLGLWPHLWFSWSVGGFSSFKFAYDEDTYALAPFGFGGRLDRVLSGGLMRALFKLSGGSYDTALVAIDAVAPLLAFTAAWMLGRVLLGDRRRQVAFAMILVFSPDIFTLANVVSPLGYGFSLSNIGAHMDRWGALLVPLIDTSYLNLYRSPEPQTTYAAAFALLALVVDMVLEPHRPVTFIRVALIAGCQILLMLGYAIVSYPVLVVEASAILVLACARAQAKAMLLSVLLAACALVLSLGARYVSGGNSGFIFQSHLPTLTVTVVATIGAEAAIVALLARAGFADRILWFAALVTAIPLLLMEQQVATDVQISVKEWERYINAPLLTIGCAIALERWRGFAHRCLASPAIALAAVVAIAVVMMATSLKSFKYWLTPNLQSLATARALSSAQARIHGASVALEDPSLAPLVRVRTGDRFPMQLDYTQLFADPIPSLRTRPLSFSPHSQHLFAFWGLTGISPEQAAAILREEVAQRGGYYLAFLFNVCDYWAPCTDGRATQSDRIVRLLPEVVAAYKRFEERQPVRDGATVYVQVSTSGPVPSHFDPTPVGTGTAGAITARVFRERSPR